MATERNTTSRRTVLAGLAAIPAAVAPAAAIPALASDHPDAELLAVGRRFDTLAEQRDRSVERWEPVWQAIQQERNTIPGTLSNDGWMALTERVEARFPERGPHPDDIAGAMNEPERAIMALPATTIAGLAVKARLAREYNRSWWDESDENADWDVLVARKLVDAVLALAEAQS
jgi:hypothetical protein